MKNKNGPLGAIEFIFLQLHNEEILLTALHLIGYPLAIYHAVSTKMAEKDVIVQDKIHHSATILHN